MNKQVLPVLLVLFIMPMTVLAGPCGDIGGSCYPTDCTGADESTGKALQNTSVAANTGCSKEYGSNYVCCTLSSNASSATKKQAKSDASASSNGAILPKPGDSGQGAAAGDNGIPKQLTGYDGNVGNYRINDLLKLGVNITNWILGMVGSASLLMFIWGGFQWLISQGEPAKIALGKKIMSSAVIGIVITFSSYIIIKFVIENVLGMSWSGGLVNF